MTKLEDDASDQWDGNNHSQVKREMRWIDLLARSGEVEKRRGVRSIEEILWHHLTVKHA